MGVRILSGKELCSEWERSLVGSVIEFGVMSSRCNLVDGWQ
jgi:hypothetical protein